MDLVPFVYDRMALLVLALTALGFYQAWSAAEPGEDQDGARWRGIFVAASVLGLSSLGLSADSQSRAFWQANFVFKPNHALAFGLVGLLSLAYFLRRRSGDEATAMQEITSANVSDVKLEIGALEELRREELHEKRNRKID